MDTVEEALDTVTIFLGLEQHEQAITVLQQAHTTFTIAPDMQEIYRADWQLLATSPHPPTGVSAFLHVANELFTSQSEGANEGK
jgi:hypothetical protein